MLEARRVLAPSDKGCLERTLWPTSLSPLKGLPRWKGWVALALNFYCSLGRKLSECSNKLGEWAKQLVVGEALA